MEEPNEIKEAILTGYPKMISYECTKNIIKQMRSNICKIKVDQEQTTGFFCKIPFPTKEKQLPVFITNNHAINEELLNSKDAKISLDIKEKKDVIQLNLNDRLKYTNEKFDVTIIELKENDNIKDFMELDDNIINDIIENKNENKEYIDKTIYIIQYPEGELSVSYDVLGNIYTDKKFEFNHKCSTRGGSSGSPILNIKNNKIIGIHKARTNNFNTNNKGTFLSFPIKEFIQREFYSNKNIGEKKLGILYKKPPLIGLANIGAYCYMNAILQCFSQIENLVFYFKNNPHINNTIMKYKKNNKSSLTESFKLIIDNLWPFDKKNGHNLIKNGNNYYFSPNDFKNKISEMNPLFHGITKYVESNDLILFLIQTVHQEMNEGRNHWDNDYNIDRRMEQLVYQNFISSFNKGNKSIISNTFYGIFHTLFKCSGCHNLIHNFQLFQSLRFPLEGIRQYKLQEILKRDPFQNQNLFNFNRRINQKSQKDANKISSLQNNKVDIYDCFDYDQKIENLIGENEYFCEFCKKLLPATLQTKLNKGPEILIIVLNRGRDIKYNVQLQFNLQLDLRNYIEDKASGYLYDLFGVITPKDKNGEKLNLIAKCKSSVDNNWYQYDDDLVFPIKDFNKEITNYTLPHLLFYKKMK